jgi:hypothetical protein
VSEDLREKSTGRRGPVLPDRPRLFLASFLMLFVELALIRWTAANDIYLAHLTNFVLLASFLGIGIGFLLAGASATCSRSVRSRWRCWSASCSRSRRRPSTDRTDGCPAARSACRRCRAG